MIREWPSTPEEKRRHRALEKRGRRYGYDQVRPLATYPLMADMVRPASLGFEEIRPGHYARRVDEEHIDLLWFQLMKGATVTIAWGTCAAYVPVRLLPRPRWSRTLKQARATLWTHSVEAWRRGDYSVPDGAISHSNGPQCIVDDTTRVWDVIGEAAQRLWTLASSPTGLLELAQRQLANPGMYDVHDPHPSFVAGFALARLGDIDASTQQIRAWATTRDPGEHKAAQQALELVATRARP